MDLDGLTQPGEVTVGSVAVSRSGASAPANGEIAERFLSRGGAGLSERGFLWTPGMTGKVLALHCRVADRRRAGGGSVKACSGLSRVQQGG